MKHWIAAVTGTLVCCLSGVPASDDEMGAGRSLIICVDGVPFEDFRSLREEGHFGYLTGTAKLISSFPSLTNPAMVEILGPAGAPISPGFEDRFYSWERNKICGGLSARLSPGFVNKSFRKLFEFHPPGYLSGFEYLLPPISCLGATYIDLAVALRRFRRSTKPIYEVYIGPTDCAAHAGGRKAVRHLLKRLDHELIQLLKKRPHTRLTLYSDHGNDYTRYRRLGLASRLKENGFRVKGRIEDNRSVVFPRFGLVGAAVLFVAPESALILADVVSRVKGVNFASVKQGDEVILFKAGQRAGIRMEDGELAYLPGKHDPLELGEAASHPRDRWFEVTKDHVFPDAVNRVWLHSDDSVLNRASVIVDVEKGYYVGSRILDVFVALQATHGSLAADQSLGFLATTNQVLLDVVSVRDAWRYLR